MGLGNWLNKLGNPERFLILSRYVTPWLGAISAALIAVGLYMSFFTAPADYQQGQTVRIMFIHVPNAWLAMMCYSMMSIAALGVLVWRHPLADIAIKSAAPLGAVFTFLALVTGALWGKPMWGTWWVWDARLTSVLVLLIIYLGIIALRQTSDSPQTARLTAILVLIGAVNIPIIKFSVEWWNTLHQPASVIRADGPTIHSSMLWPLMIMMLGLTALFFLLHLWSIENEIHRRRARSLQSKLATQSTTPLQE